MENISEIIDGLSKKYPAFQLVAKDFPRLAEAHPDWQKISDFPPFNCFPEIDWDNEALLKSFLDSLLDETMKEINYFRDSRQSGQEMAAIINLATKYSFFKWVTIYKQMMSDWKNPEYKNEVLQQAVFSMLQNTN